jgi:hypothetical protein
MKKQSKSGYGKVYVWYLATRWNECTEQIKGTGHKNGKIQSWEETV